MAEETQREFLDKRLNSLKQERLIEEPLWRDLGDLFSPLAPRFLTNEGRTQSKASRYNKIINNTALVALDVLVSGMMSGLTSPARPWFQLTASDPDLMKNQEVKDYLYKVKMRMMDVFSKTNLYNALPLAYRDLAVFGTCSMPQLPDARDIVRFYNNPIGSFFIATGDRNLVDTHILESQKTVRQLVMKYGYDNCSARVQRLWDSSDYETYVDVVHHVAPNENRDLRLLDNKNMKWMSLYYEANREDDNQKFLKKSGYDYFPVRSARWDVIGNDVYGYGPSLIALGDNKTLQLEEKRKYQGIDKIVSPTMVADATLRQQRSQAGPNQTLYVPGLAQGNKGYYPAYEINAAAVTVLSNDITVVENRIREAMYYNLFMLISSLGDQPNITATQVNFMREEKMMRLGPVLERLEDELLDPIIEGTYIEMNARKLLPKVPDILQGQNLKVEYTSILSQAQKAAGIGVIERFVGFAGNIIASDPQVKAKLKMPAIIDEYAAMIGVPPTITTSEAEYNQIIDAQNQKAQQQETAQNLMTAAQGAETLSKAKLSDPNVLSTVLGAGGA